jgi:hypothetical protein
MFVVSYATGEIGPDLFWQTCPMGLERLLSKHRDRPYPGCKPGEIRGGAAATFEEARAAFEAAWRIFRAGCTEADFQAWREDRDWHARKYAMWDRGKSCLGSCRIR